MVLTAGGTEDPRATADAAPRDGAAARALATSATLASRYEGADRSPISRGPVVAVGLSPIALGLLHGGYFPGTWLALGVLAAAVFFVLRAGAGPTPRWFRPALSRPAAVAVVCLSLFALWNLASALWATDAAAATLEGTRALLYLLVMTATLAVARDHRDSRLLLSTLALAGAGVALATVLGMASSASPENYFRFFKLNEPIGYYNAEAAFFAVPALVAVHLASRRSTRTLLRPLLFAAGVVLLEAGVLTQSRGGFWAFAAALVVYLVLVPDRPRALLWWGVALALVVLAFGRLNGPHLDLRDHDFAALLQSSRSAAAAVAASTAGALLAAGALVLADTRLSFGRRATNAGRGAAAAVVVIAVVLLFVRFPSLTDPVGAIETGWSQFKGTQSSPSDVRILDLSGSRRYELWQVAWRTFEESPARGVGADNYVVAWNRSRPISHDVKQPHNLYLRLLAELGVPGLALFLAAVATAVGAGLSRRRTRPHHDRALLACLVAACVLFLVHAAADWVWQVPAVGVTFFIMLGLLLGNASNGVRPAAADDPSPDDGDDPSPDDADEPRAPRPTPLTAAAAVGIAVAVLCVPQLLAVRLDDRSDALLAQGEPALARQAASWAARCNPLWGEPDALQGKAAAAAGDLGAAEAAFAEAVSKNPSDWHTYVLWGDAVREEGGDPTRLYRLAAEWNPLSYDVRERLGRTGG